MYGASLCEIFLMNFCVDWQKSLGEQSSGGIGNLTQKLNQLKKQIQAERVASIKVDRL